MALPFLQPSQQTPLADTPNAVSNPFYRWQQAFWDTGAVPGGNYESLLPDVSSSNVLSDRWNWEVIYMAGMRVPGLADVDFGREHRVDKRAANGADGQSLTSLGYRAAEIVVKIRLWTPQQLADFQTITIPSIQPRSGKANARPVAVTVDYPALAMWGVSKLFVVKVAGPKRTHIPQCWEVTLTCTENAPIMPVGAVTQKGAGVASAPNSLAGKPPVPALVVPPPSKSINSPNTGQ